MSSPVVSIVMSVYNEEKYVKYAIESILSQTYTNFEFIIINDGSTDESLKIIRRYKDARIHVISRENKGLVQSLNEGITIARGTYIARQDADDISDINRLKYQLDYLNNNPSVVLLGSSMQVMNEFNEILHTHHVLLNNLELKEELLVRSPFAHGSVLFKKNSALSVGLYKEQYWPAEDYDLWLRLSTEGDFSNINKPLYIYRENSNGISSLNSDKQAKKTAEIRRAAWKRRTALIPRTTLINNLSSYAAKEDGAQRIQRIEKNITTALNQALKTFDIKTLWILYNLRSEVTEYVSKKT